MTRFLLVVPAFISTWLALPTVSIEEGPALAIHAGSPVLAQSTLPSVRPTYKGRKHKVTLDSSPQQGTVFWAVPGKDSGDPKTYGVAGYTPLTLSLPRGRVKLVIEQVGFKPIAQELDVKRTQKISFTMERAPRAGSLDLRSSGDNSATGAEVFIDGVSRGTIPNVFELTAGRHQLEVKKKDFVDFSEWVTLNEAELRTRDVSLKKEAGAGGSILIIADSGMVFLDGEKKDAAPTLLAGVTPGEHVVEIRKEGETPFRTIVKVEAGQQVKVNGSPAGGLTGSLRVLSNEQDVDVFLDGRMIGKAPVELPSVQAGQHVVEGKKKGFSASEEVVKLTPGEQLLVRLKMEKAPDEKPRGMLSVKSAVPNAEVFLDGASLGAAPIDRKDLSPGKHYVVVRKKGYRDFSREVQLEENRPVSVVAELAAVTRVKFLSSPAGATVFIDDEPIEGSTPSVKDEVPAGEHQISFRLKGYDETRKTVTIEGGEDRIIQADLVPTRTGPTRAELSEAKQGLSTWGAKALPKGGFAADVGMGYPYWLYGRLTVHAWERKNLKIDAGVEMRSYFQTWEFNLHSRMQFIEAGPFSLGARVLGGGGPGFNGRNTWSMQAGPLATMSFSNIVHFTVDASLQYYSDRLCPSSDDISRDVEPREVCREWDTSDNNQIFDGRNPEKNRFSDMRFLVGGALEVVINRYFSAWVKLDFLPGQFNGRAAYKDKVNSALFERDQLVYTMAGATIKL